MKWVNTGDKQAGAGPENVYNGIKKYESLRDKSDERWKSPIHGKRQNIADRNERRVK